MVIGGICVLLANALVFYAVLFCIYLYEQYGLDCVSDMPEFA